MERARIVIVGTGFSGLGLAARLKREGIHDFAMLERADEVGGTWRDNSYPGCACDVPSHLYSFSFAPNPDWSSTHSPRDEIYGYLRDCADRFGIRPHIRFRHEMTGADWDADARVWRVATTRGEIEARYLALATGPFSDPLVPRIPGIARFRGKAFHSARWDHDHDLTAERVAVIGTGASALQVVPSIQPKVERLLLLQRTPPWVMPRGERRISGFEQRLYRRVPLAQKLARAGNYWSHEAMLVGFQRAWMIWPVEFVGRVHLWARVRDRELRRKLRPGYRLGCKRVLNSNLYFDALTKPNVDLVTEAIEEVTERGIRTADGVEHEVDTIIYGTGFHLNDPPVRALVRGRDGRSLAEVWGETRFALRGTTVAGFPNMFMMAGPNTGIGTTSLVYLIESQSNYVVDCLRYAERNGVGAAAPSADAQAAFNEWLQGRFHGTVWADGCRAHYHDPNGRNTAIWPTYTFRFRAATRRFDPAEYELEPSTQAARRPEPASR